MKIKVSEMPYSEVIKLPHASHKKPTKPNPFLKRLIKTLSDSSLKKIGFTYEIGDMKSVSDDTPCLILMNHSSFIDLEIAAKILYPRPYHIVCTSDGFVGKESLMRGIGCIPTTKFVTDATLVKDMHYALTKLKNSVLMYPEASYSFDGTSSKLPHTIAKCIKLLKVPVVMIKTAGAFSHDPLYNMLKVRNVPVSAKMHCVLTPEEIENLSTSEIYSIIKKEFTFDYFKWQQDNKIEISEDFRADGLNRVLYKCPHCMSEDSMEGIGSNIVCHNCNASYELTTLGYLKNNSDTSIFTHVPDWYKWERECVRKEIEDGTYNITADVDIMMMVDYKSIYHVGSGVLTHNLNGFNLIGCDGELSFSCKPTQTYSCYSDYYWYEIGDVICIGDTQTSYYCFPKDSGDIVAKIRLATEELYSFGRCRKENGAIAK